MGNFSKQLVGFFYGTNRRRKRFESHENENVLAADGSKGILTKQNSDISRGANWIFSQRAVLLLTDKRVVCGKWNIIVEKIKSVTLVKIKSLFGEVSYWKLTKLTMKAFSLGCR